MRGLAKLLFPFLVGGALVWLTVRDLPLAALQNGATSLAGNFHLGWAVGAGAAFAGLMLLHGLRFRAVLARAAPLTLFDAVSTYTVATLLNVFVPARGGDLYKPLRASRLSQTTFAEALGLATADLCLWGLGFVVWMIAIAAFRWQQLSELPTLRLAVLAESVALVVGLTLWILGRERWRQLPEPQRKWLSRPWRFVHGIDESLTWRATQLAVPLAVAGWGCEILIAWCASHSFGIELGLVQSALLMAAVTTAMIVPAPGGIGPFEAAGAFVLGLYQVPKAEAALVAIAYHLVFIVLPLTLGCALWLIQRLKNCDNPVSSPKQIS